MDGAETQGLNLPTTSWRCDNCNGPLFLMRNDEDLRKDGQVRRRIGKWAHLKPTEKTCKEARWHGNKFYMGPRDIKRRKPMTDEEIDDRRRLQREQREAGRAEREARSAERAKARQEKAVAKAEVKAAAKLAREAARAAKKAATAKGTTAKAEAESTPDPEPNGLGAGTEAQASTVE